VATSRRIVELVQEIGRTRSPIQRMRLLARGWGQLRSLTPIERRRIVEKLGVEQFETVLERLGTGEAGIEPEELDLILDTVGEVDPQRVRDLIAGLKDPSVRKSMARRGLQILKGRLGREKAGVAETRPEAGGAAAASDPAVHVRQGPAQGAIAPPAVTGAASPTLGEALPAPPSQPPSAPIKTPAPSPEPPRTRAAPQTRTSVRGAAPASAPVRRPAPGLSPEPDARIEGPGGGGVLEAFRSATSLIARFRLLTKLLRDGERPPAERIREIVALFPDGWSRRRALSAFLRAGLPERTDEALSLIWDLERESDRRWCALVLASTRRLGPDERRSISETFPSPTLHRRLARSAAPR